MDVIIDPDERQLTRLVELLRPVAMAELPAALDALERRFMFNVIGFETVEKIDFIILKATRHERTMFERRRRVAIAGIEAWMVTPEDSILSKLQWSKVSKSETQLRDIVGTCPAQSDRLDWEYLRRGVEILGLASEFEAVERAVEMRRRP